MRNQFTMIVLAEGVHFFGAEAYYCLIAMGVLVAASVFSMVVALIFHTPKAKP